DIKLGKFSDWLRRERMRLAEDAAQRAPEPPVAERVAGGGAPVAVQHVNPVIVVDQILQITEADEDIRLAKVFRHDQISRLVRFREWSVADEVTEELSRSAAPIYRVSISAMRAERSV